MSKKSVVVVALLAVVGAGLLWWQSGRSGTPPAELPPEHSPQERAALARKLLDRGVAQFEIAKTAEDLDATAATFAALRELAPTEPAAHLGLAVLEFKRNELEKARAHLDRVGAGPSPELAAWVEYLRGRMAYESGKTTEVTAAYQRATELHPLPAYFYALAEAHRAAREDALALRALQAAWRQRAELNVVIAIELALEVAGSEDAAARREGVEAMDAAAAACLAPPRFRADGEAAQADREAREKIEAGLAEARPQMLENAGSPPRALRIAGNLLRGTTRFQADSKAMRAQLEVRPLERLGLPELNSPLAVSVPTVKFPLRDGLPALPGPLVALAVIDDADESAPPAAREAGLLVVAGKSLMWLSREAQTWQPVGLQSPEEPRQLLSGDLDGDGLMEVVVLGSSGLAVLKRGEDGAWATAPDPGGLATADTYLDAILTDHNHDGFLDLLALSAGHDAPHNLVLFRNAEAQGLGAEQAFPMDANGRWERLVSVDLDLDGDQDLLLAGDGALVQVTNQRQELFEAHLVAHLQPRLGALEAADLDGDGYPEAVVMADGSITVLAGSARGVTERHLPGSEAAAGALALRLRARCLAVTDLDLDGRQDVVVGGEIVAEESRPVQMLAVRSGQLQLAALLLEGTTHRAVNGLLPIDLDGDRARDLVLWNPSGEVLTHRASGLADQQWIGLRLRAPSVIVAGSKVPLDAKGVRVECHSAAGRQVLQARRPNLVIGVGQHAPHLIRLVWPNGMSEFLFDPATRADHEVLLVIRLEGSCPYLYAWNGERYEFVTDVLGISPLGMQVAPHVHNSMHPEEYLRLPDWIRERDGRIELSLTEELREVTFLDQVELVAVDHPAEVLAYNGERFVMPPVEGLDLRLLGALAAPAAVTSDSGDDVLDIVRAEDHRYLTNYTSRTRYQGLVNSHAMTVDLGETARAAGGNVALLLVGWLQWGNTSTNVAIGHDPSTDFIWPRLEVPDGDGGWRATDVRLGLPAGKPKPVALDLSGVIDPADPRIRIVTNLEVYWDRIAVARRLDPAVTEHRIQRLAPIAADYSYGGYSRWFRPAENGPDLFDYSDRRPYPWRDRADGSELRCAFDELEGFYVAYGSVTALLAGKDDLSVTVGAGDEVRISFDARALQPIPEGWRRTYFLHSEGWDKDGDFNTAHGQTVEPLPFHARRAYPSDEPFPDSPAHRHYEERTLSRWVSSDRLIKTAATAPPPE